MEKSPIFSESLTPNAKAALFVTAVLDVAAVLWIASLVLFVVPALEMIFKDIGQALPAPTRFVQGMSRYWYLAIPVVAHRPGSGTVLRREHLPFLEGERWRLVNSWSLPEVSQDISSTRLRSLLAAGKDVGDSIPLAVLEALESGGWYQQSAP